MLLYPVLQMLSMVEKIGQTLTPLLHTTYHPRNAVRSEREGIFSVHHFKDGAQLRVRRMFEKKLFDSQPWEQVSELPSNPMYSGAKVALHQVNNFKFVTRSFPKLPRDSRSLSSFYFYALEAYPESRVELLQKILGKKIPVESPVLELSTPQGHRLIATRLAHELAPGLEWPLSEKKEEQVVNLAHLMATWHAAGFSHGHLLLQNILFRGKKFTVIDPKYVRELKQRPHPDDIEETVARLKKGLDRREPDSLVESPVLRPTLAIPNDLLVTLRQIHKSHYGLFLDAYAEKYRTEYERRNRATSSQRH